MTTAPAATGWQGHLQLDYSRRGERTIALDRHHGPLRVLQRLYPEGETVCHPVLATLWLAEAPGQALGRERSEALIAAARALIDASAVPATAGVSAPAESLLVLRALGHQVEPVMALLQKVWACWRALHWRLAPCAPRLWRT